MTFNTFNRKLFLFDILPKFSELIDFTTLSSHLGGQYTIITDEVTVAYCGEVPRRNVVFAINR